MGLPAVFVAVLIGVMVARTAGPRGVVWLT